MKTIKLLTLSLIVLGFSIQPEQIFGMNGKLLAGTAKVNITPKTNMPLHDSLYARCVVLDINGERLAFVSVDLGIYTNDRLQNECKEKYGISQLMLCSSHTHSGSNDRNSNLVEERIMSAIAMATKHMFPAKICAGRSSFPQLGFNRLVVREDGHSRESWFPDDHYTSENPERIPFGPVDPEVGAIKIEDMTGQTRVVMMNYACHADIVCSNYAISADYPGVACRKVEEAYGNKVNCLFVQGAGGNIESLIISSRRTGPDDPFQTDYNTIERVGGLLAYETVKLTKSLKPEASDSTEIKYMNDSLKFTGRFNKTTNFNINISTILINKNIVIATCPGEPFIQLQLDWKKKIEEASGNPFLFGYTWYKGSWPNYIPDIKSSAQGGYGADQDSPTLIQVGAGESIMNKHFENYFKINGLMRDKTGPVGFTSGSRWIMMEVPRKN
jgi:neutral ceramidase